MPRLEWKSYQDEKLISYGRRGKYKIWKAHLQKGVYLKCPLSDPMYFYDVRAAQDFADKFERF